MELTNKTCSCCGEFLLSYEGETCDDCENTNENEVFYADSN